MTIRTQHLPQWKTDEVEAIREKSTTHALVGLVDMYGIPASQLQQIRANLRGIAEVKMSRNTLMEEAFLELGDDGPGILREHLDGQSALIFSNENPFRLFKQLEKTKTKMAAKPGETSPEDIVIPKGPTSFKPGPIVGELQQAGIPAVIEGGKVKVRESRTVVKAGDTISKKMADVLAKLDIKPMDVGLRLQVAFFEGSLFTPDMLSIDESVYYDRIVLAAQQAFNLAVNAVYPTPVTIGPILAKAVTEARNLGVEACIYEPALMDAIIARAYRQSSALKGMIEE